MRYKYKSFTSFVRFFCMKKKTQFEKLIKCLCSDNEEYAYHDMSKFLSKNGVIYEFTCGYITTK